VTVEQQRLTELLFDIPCKVWSINAERTVHWAERDRLVAQARDGAYLTAKRLLALHRVRDLPLFTRVDIVAQPWRRVRRGGASDPGNAYPTVKACLDGLVLAGVLADDASRYVASALMLPEEYGRDALVLTLREVDQQGRNR
jgi:crossover junction endodeoxyribonuclease RusA